MGLIGPMVTRILCFHLYHLWVGVGEGCDPRVGITSSGLWVGVGEGCNLSWHHQQWPMGRSVSDFSPLCDQLPGQKQLEGRRVYLGSDFKGDSPPWWAKYGSGCVRQLGTLCQLSGSRRK